MLLFVGSPKMIYRMKWERGEMITTNESHTMERKKEKNRQTKRFVTWNIIIEHNGICEHLQCAIII